MRRAIQTADAPAAIGPYSQAVHDEETGFLYCSGQIGLDPATGDMVAGGTKAEMKSVLANMSAVLADSISLRSRSSSCSISSRSGRPRNTSSRIEWSPKAATSCSR